MHMYVSIFWYLLKYKKCIFIKGEINYTFIYTKQYLSLGKNNNSGALVH